jgi:hypothetical protein
LHCGKARQTIRLVGGAAHTLERQTLSIGHRAHRALDSYGALAALAVSAARMGLDHSRVCQNFRQSRTFGVSTADLFRTVIYASRKFHTLPRFLSFVIKYHQKYNKTRQKLQEKIKNST